MAARSGLPAAARLIVLVGVASALHVGKLPPALPRLALDARWRRLAGAPVRV